LCFEGGGGAGRTVCAANCLRRRLADNTATLGVVAVLLAKTVILLNTAHTELGGGVVAWPTAGRSRINLQPTKQYFHLRDEGFSLSLSLPF